MEKFDKPANGKSTDINSTTGKAVFDPKAFLATVNHGRTVSEYRKDEVVFLQASPADSVFYIQKGKIKIVVASTQGKEAVVALLGPGDFFGEGCLAGQPVRLASAVTTTASNIIKIDKESMTRLLPEKQDFAEKFMAFLMSRNIQVEADLVDQLFNSSEKRLARLLLLLANFNNDGDLRLIVPKISQEVLAARVGTTRSRINYFMNKFRKLGLIEYNGTLKVHSSLLNVIVRE